MRELLARYRRISSAVDGAIDALERELGPGAAAPQRGPARIATLLADGDDIDALLDFQERLSEIDGVLKVTVAGTQSGRTTFLVELADDSRQLVVCANCGKVLQDGQPPASHGLCDDCRSAFGRLPT